MRILFKLCMAIGLALAVPSMAVAQSASVAVASEDRTEADREQDEGRKPAEVLAFAGIAQGETVADLMAGGGYYTALIADMVGHDGTVYAVNPANFHNAEAWEARLARHRNIRTIVTSPPAMVLAPGSVDTIFTHLVFHDLWFESERFEFPRLDARAMIASWFAAVKPGGHVIVVDHVGPAGDTREIVNALHRIDPETVVTIMTDAGFRLVDQSDMLRRSNDDHSKSVFDPAVRGKTDRFVMKFQKPE